MSEGILDSQAIAQINLSIHLIQQSEEFGHYEIDSIPGILGDLYRVWGGEKGINLLGTFYQSIDGHWISQPCRTSQCGCWLTDAEAIASITA
ncbi:hypothetical protein [Nostoc sp. DedQUE07]|uniref:hypothetical protein n=1 Tax=Nostoc sp. DedQUE07 TaxID=3075392 RepID=UPI002AD49FE3|nr:hypothetical protein [Nostoc sp. DedQUE07]MDZ8131917.1 hypothetical protein [Nostoc sp. DedQUE07]